MIRSVKFPEEGNGYIYEKYEKPEKPYKNSRFNREGSYEKALEQYKEDMKVYKANKGKFLVPAAYNLVGREFLFEDGKINVLFGPNASGKTTIIKTIAGECVTEDGFTSLRQPVEFHKWWEDENYDVAAIVTELMKNTAYVEWDGVPVYYDNFEYTKSNSHGVFGGLVGSALQSLNDEIEYHLTSKHISAGQNTLYLIEKILRIASNKTSLKLLCESDYEKRFKRCNDKWKKCGEAQMKYFSKYPKYDVDSYPTLIFDEIDKSLDIETVWRMYSEFFPMLVEKYGCQVILVSHSPLIISETIMKNDKYNVISVDEAYTKEVKNMLSDVRF
ncbi:MAG: hypothetical protein J6X18_01185 [Bacteroidales bacterium]|nr:hypothetical protein [Bacteroidales bacterium]